MGSQASPKELKKLVAPHLREIPGVVAVGTSNNQLTFYLEEDQPQVRQRVAHLMERLAPKATYQFMLGGTFVPHGTGGDVTTQ